MQQIKFTDELYEVGKLPPLGTIPKKMHAWTIRSERLGDPLTAYQEEIVTLPALKAGEVLVANMAAGVNYNGIWAARGVPKNVILNNGSYGDKNEEFHICGSESSGIVYAVGEGVADLEIGDEVCLAGLRYDPKCPVVKEKGTPEYSPTYHIWGYEANWGAFAQFSKVYDFQCIKKPTHLTWEEAATCGATGATVYRMLNHWKGNQIKKDDVVLIWGGSGGVGSATIQQVKCCGGIPVAVVSDDNKGKFCMNIGATGYINRNQYHHWGNISNLNEMEYKKWFYEATMFRNAIYDIVGERKSPAIVVEHPGSDTLATSLFVCDNGGMVVLCGATSGYIGSIDLRYLWLYQKRLQGSHGSTREDYYNFFQFSQKYRISPIIHKSYDWDELPQAHCDMANGCNISGKLAIRIGDRRGLL